jgi:hypothetical protein
LRIREVVHVDIGTGQGFMKFITLRRPVSGVSPGPSSYSINIATMTAAAVIAKSKRHIDGIGIGIGIASSAWTAPLRVTLALLVMRIRMIAPPRAAVRISRTVRAAVQTPATLRASAALSEIVIAPTSAAAAVPVVRLSFASQLRGQLSSSYCPPRAVVRIPRLRSCAAAGRRDDVGGRIGAELQMQAHKACAVGRQQAEQTWGAVDFDVPHAQGPQQRMECAPKCHPSAAARREAGITSAPMSRYGLFGARGSRSGSS